MRTALLASLSFGWIASSALAQAPARTNALALSSQAPPSLVQEPAGKATKAAGRDGTDGRPHRGGAPARPEHRRGRLSGCLVLWEPATHMTKRQWARACQRVAERLKDTAVQ
jgi:hypothetical protein